MNASMFEGYRYGSQLGIRTLNVTTGRRHTTLIVSVQCTDRFDQTGKAAIFARSHAV